MPDFKSPVISADGVILKNDRILLVKRNIEPFEEFWCLPGGHVEYGEKVEQTIRREAKEELGIKVGIKELIGVYSDPDRDPRYHSISIAFWLKWEGGQISLDREASSYNFYDLERLPQKIGFDHREIIGDFKEEQQV